MSISAVQRLKVGALVAVRPALAFSVLPAGNRFLKSSTRVIGEEVSNVGIVFKLPVDRRWMRLFLFQNLMIRPNRVAAGLSGVGAQPFLKRHAEGKALPGFLRRKRPVRFGAHLVRLDDRLPGDRSAAGGRFSLRPRPRDRSGIEKIRGALDKLRLAARNRKMVPAAERGQFFLQIIIAAKRLCV